jgi:hypothetical protein
VNAFVALIINCVLDPVEGVPDITPVEVSNDKPVGNTPSYTDHVAELPVYVIDWL